MLIVALLAGVLVGALMQGPFGAVVGGLLAFLLLRLREQERAIATLQRLLERPPAAAETAAAVTPPRAVVPSPSAAAAAASAAAPARPVAAASGSPAARVDDVAPVAPPRPALPAPLAALKAWLFGGNTIVKAGVGILFVGLAFLAKYTTEHVQVPVEFRLAGIGAAAIVLLALGWRLRLSRPGYAQVLQGGAVAVLYLTLFVAFRYFGVIAALPAFGAMVVVAALAAALAVLQDAPALAVVGALGGFATPLLVSSGSGNHVALFSYYLVLDLGIAAVAWFRTWRALNFVGFVFTFFVAAAWGVLSYRPANFASGEAFLIAFFLLFNAVLLMPARRAETAAQGAERWLNGSLLFGLPTISFVLQHGLVHDYEYGSALSALAMAAFYTALAFAVRSRPRLALLFDGTLAVAIVFVSLVIPFALDERSTAGAWALEGGALVWIGLRQQRTLLRVFGYTLLLLAGLWLGTLRNWRGAATAGFDSIVFNALLVTAGSFVGAAFARRLPAGARWGEAHAEPVLIGWGTLWALVALSWQVEHAADFTAAMATWLAGLSAIALVQGALAARLDWPRIALPAAGHAPLLALAVTATAAAGVAPAAGAGAWSWPLALLAHGLLLRLAAPRWPAPASQAVHGIGLLVLAGLGALQGRAITEPWGDLGTAWAWLGWFALPALLLLALPALAVRWPLRLAPVAYDIAAGIVAAGLLLWTLLANAICDGSASPLPWLPLVNPLDLGIAVALFAVARWSRGDAARRLPPMVVPALLGGCAFIWLNGMLVRGFHHLGGIAYQVDAWSRSTAVQAGLTLLWSSCALALMWVSARRRQRAPWMVGAALLAVVVAKLLLVDLAGTGTVARIVSFIGVGVLMLVIGYVAPLPAAEAGDARA